MRAFQRIQTEDEELRRVQDSVEAFAKPLTMNPLLDGLLLEGADGTGVALVSGQANYVNHGLGRAVKFWPVSPNADARVWEDTANPDAATILVLRCSADVTLRLWVF